MVNLMEKERVLASILGIAGLGLIFYVMMLSRISISDEIHYEHWEIVMFSDALMLYTISFILGILALVFQNERKSPYLMGISTITTVIGFIFPYFRFVRLGISYQAGALMLYAFGQTITLLVSTILLAYTNIWKKPFKPT